MGKKMVLLCRHKGKTKKLYCAVSSNANTYISDAYRVKVKFAQKF